MLARTFAVSIAIPAVMLAAAGAIGAKADENLSAARMDDVQRARDLAAEGRCTDAWQIYWNHIRDGDRSFGLSGIFFGTYFIHGSFAEPSALKSERLVQQYSYAIMLNYLRRHMSGSIPQIVGGELNSEAMAQALAELRQKSDLLSKGQPGVAPEQAFPACYPELGAAATCLAQFESGRVLPDLDDLVAMVDKSIAASGNNQVPCLPNPHRIDPPRE